MARSLPAAFRSLKEKGLSKFQFGKLAVPVALSGNLVATPPIVSRWSPDTQVATPPTSGRRSPNRVAEAPIPKVVGMTIAGMPHPKWNAKGRYSPDIVFYYESCYAE